MSLFNAPSEIGCYRGVNNINYAHHVGSDGTDRVQRRQRTIGVNQLTLLCADCLPISLGNKSVSRLSPATDYRGVVNLNCAGTIDCNELTWLCVI